MMRNCNRCFEKHWKYELIETTVRATCQSCDYEVEFPARKRKVIEYDENEPAWTHKKVGQYHQRRVEFETIDGKTKMRTCDNDMWYPVALNPLFPDSTKEPLIGGTPYKKMR